jgi:hypothetical protein
MTAARVVVFVHAGVCTSTAGAPITSLQPPYSLIRRDIAAASCRSVSARAWR